MTTTTMTASPLRTYDVSAESTDTFGRVRGVVRNHVLVIDGPKHNGAPGERPTPGETMLTAAAACGAEVVQVLARDAGVAIDHVVVHLTGTIDPEKQPHPSVTVFSAVAFVFRLRGPSSAEAATLVGGFQRRCPVFGSLAIASGRIDVDFVTEPATGNGGA